MNEIDKRVYLALLHLYVRSDIAKDDYISIVSSVCEMSDEDIDKQIEGFSWHKAIVTQFLKYQSICNKMEC